MRVAVQESSNRARPVSIILFFMSELKLRPTQFWAEALSLCHVIVVTMVTACLQQLHT